MKKIMGLVFVVLFLSTNGFAKAIEQNATKSKIETTKMVYSVDDSTKTKTVASAKTELKTKKTEDPKTTVDIKKVKKVTSVKKEESKCGGCKEKEACVIVENK